MRRTSRCAAATLCLALLTGCTAEDTAAPESNGEQAELLRVVDGDTIRVEVDGVDERVRLLGIDAPELGRDGDPDEPCAVRAGERLEELLDGGPVMLVEDASQGPRDQYDRLLVYVDTLDGTDVGEVLLAEGLAEVFRDARDAHRQEDYLAAARSAAVPACAR